MNRLNSTAALALAGLFLITGCKTVGPDFEKPDAPVADSWLNALLPTPRRRRPRVHFRQESASLDR